MTFLGHTLTAIWLILFIFLWVLIAFWPALLAKTKGYSFWLFFLASLFFWWIMFFVALFLPNKNLPAVDSRPTPPSSTPPTPPAPTNTID